MTKKIIGIGNAIVDIVCEIEDDFLEKNSLIKGSMSLIDEAAAQKLSQIKSIKTTSGGSTANSVAAIAQLGGDVAYVGKVARDEFGHKIINEIEKIGVKFISQNFSSDKTASSFILVSKDGQRTMATFLGCASQIDENDIKEDDIKTAAVLYLEGYLWDQASTINALKKAISLAKKHGVKIAFTLSDSFCVARHKPDFIDLIANDLDILFANENEIEELLEIKNIEENNFKNLRDFFAKNKKLVAAITRSEKGCVVFDEKNIYQKKPEKIIEPLDTTGAGDCFAAGFLYGFVENKGLEKSAEIGNEMAAKIIQVFGARLH